MKVTLFIIIQTMSQVATYTVQDINSIEYCEFIKQDMIEKLEDDFHKDALILFSYGACRSEETAI